MKKGFSSASSSLPLVTRMFLLGLDQAHAFAQHDGVVGGIELIRTDDRGEQGQKERMGRLHRHHRPNQAIVATFFFS
jgi:hypothetical protein